MKRKLLLIYISILVFIPIKVSAIEIIETEISGTTEKMVGEEFIIDYKINFDNIEKNETTGIWFLQYELDFNEENLLITDITSNNFNTQLYKENDKYYILSEVIENENNENICNNGILHCSNYTSTIKFYIKKTDLTETTIKIKDTKVGLLNIIDETKIYTLDDIIEITNTDEQSHTIKINKSTTEIKEEPKNIIINNKPTLKEEKRNITQENDTSSSAFIKELKIKNYKIEFDKNKTNYNITIEKDINELDINVTLENDKATYRIIGADDLKSNNNEIAIIVTSEDNNIITYTINVKHDVIIEEKKDTKKVDIKLLIKKYLTKDNLTYAGITIGIIIIIILLFILKNKKENKKINKLLGEL